MIISATERIEDFAITVNKRLLTFCDTGWSYSKIVGEKETPDQQWKGKNGEKIFAKTITTKAYPINRWFKLCQKYADKINIPTYRFHNNIEL